MPHRYRSLRTLLLGLALVAAVPAWAQTYVGVIDPAGDPLLHDLEWRDGALWATDRIGDRFMRIDLDDGDILESVAPGFEPLGLAWDGANWRLSESFTSTPEVFTVSPTGTVLGQIPAPSQLTNGLAFHDGRLFAANAYPDAGANVVGLDPATGAVLESVAFPSTQPTGIAFTGTNTMWVANAGDDSGSSGVYDVYEIDRPTGALLRTLAPPPGMTRPRGVAYDGSRYLYVTFRRTAVPQISLIYKVDLLSNGNPQLTLSAESFDFGVRAAAAPGPYLLPLTLQNVGDAPLTISDVQVATNPENPFGTTLAPTTIQPGAQTTVQVTFRVFEPLRSTGTLSFETNDVNRPLVEIPLRGIGVFPQPTVTFLEGTHDFGPVRIDEPLPVAASAAWWPMRVVNLGAQTLQVTGVSLDEPAFSVVATPFPLAVAPADTADVLVEFRPTETRLYAGAATVASNDPAGPTSASLTGEGIDPTLAGGTPLWSWTVPENPATSSTDFKVHSIRVLGDVTGDGQPELAIATRNYWTLVVDANGWGEPRLVWSYSSCPDNNDCGAVSGNAQLYEYGLAIAPDLNGDGSADVVIGTEGGSDKVVALDGRTGVPIWTVGSVSDPYLASYYSVSPRFDVTGDGVADVATGTGSADLANSPDPYNHRRVYLLNGASGAEVWQAQTALPNFRTSLIRTVAGPRVVTGGGESASNFVRAFDAVTGAQGWTHTPSYSPFLVEPVADTRGGADEDVLAAGLGSLVQRLDGATGAVEWTANAGGSSVWDVEVVYRASGPPLVVVGSTGSAVAAFDAATGLDAWQYPMGGQVFDVAAVPDVDGDGSDDVAATGRFGQTTLISGATGTLIWSHTFGNDTFAQSGETAVSVPDLDGNGVPEVAFGVRDGRVILLHGGNPTLPATEPGTVPNSLSLDPPAPNPVRGAARLRYALPAPAGVRLALYDALGREVWHLDAGAQAAGTHAATLDAGRLSAGVYVLRLEAGGAVRTRRLAVVR